MPAQPSVEDYLASLVHARKDAVVRLRDVVRAALPDLTETVKWNAPSYAADGTHLVTFRLHPRDQVQLVLHRGARAASGPGEVPFDDPAGLVVRASPDRGTVTFTDLADVEAKADAVARLVRSWCDAATG